VLLPPRLRFGKTNVGNCCRSLACVASRKAWRCVSESFSARRRESETRSWRGNLGRVSPRFCCGAGASNPTDCQGFWRTDLARADHGRSLQNRRRR
jgi:hypothetical protein